MASETTEHQADHDDVDVNEGFPSFDELPTILAEASMMIEPRIESTGSGQTLGVGRHWAWADTGRGQTLGV